MLEDELKLSSENKIPSDGSPHLKGVRRSMQILEFIALHPGRATDVADALKIPWATLHRTLGELEKGGFVEKDIDSNRYSIGARMWFIGTAYVAGHKVLEVARPYLDQAAEKGDYTVQLVERSGRLAVTLYSYQRAGEIITKSAYGFHFPLHCGSKGQVLLAYSPIDEIERYLANSLESLTPETITSAQELRYILANIKLQGYAQTVGDVQQFTGSMSAPVFDRSSQIVGAICFITKRSSLKKPSTSEDMLETLLRTAQSVSLAMGWRPSGNQ